jgi:DNA-binding transcriptional MerR regulator
MGRLLIGDVAQRAGVSAPTIRYYERLGLLEAPRRTDAGYRRYTDATIEQLRFIRKAQGLGFSLDEVGEILKLTRSGETPCSRVLSLGRQHLKALEDRIRQLQRFQVLLAAELARWEQQETLPSCDGLCQFIADADDDMLTRDSATLPRPVKASSASVTRKGRR